MGKDSAPISVLDYVCSFRERLQKACELAKTHLSIAQSKMKTHFEKRAVQCSFQPGESVLVLLPIPSSALQAKFSGPYSRLFE